MVQFTLVQQSVMNQHLDTFEGKINITQMVRDIGLPVSAWVSVNNYVKEYFAESQIDGIPELVLGNMVDLPDVVSGDPFPMPSGTINLDSADEQLAKQEEYYAMRLEATTAGRNAINVLKKALRT
jgi:hypothetical protein